MPASTTFAQKYLWPADMAGRLARVILGLLLAACLANLWLAPDPSKGIAARQAAGKKPMVKHYVATYNWYMAAANSVLLLGLLASTPLWVRRTTALRDASRSARPDALTWGLLAGATGVLLYFAGPRMDHSLWGDEEYTFRRNIHGEHVRQDPKNYDSPLELKRVGWLDTVYGYKKPNNHILQTILSRAGHEAWLSTRPPEEHCAPQVQEWVLRLPSLMAGLATLPLLVGLGAAMGQARVGGIAAVLLAFHPWFQRYATEARGYAIVMFFSVALVLLLLLALRTGRWRWWILYGLSQFLLLWCYVGAFFVPLSLNVFALVFLLWRRRAEPEWFMSQAPRWFVMNLLAAMCFFQMMAPCLPMLRDYLHEDPSVPEEMGHVWFKDVAGHMLGGMDGSDSWKDAPLYQSWGELARERPILFVLALAGTAGVALLGLYSLIRLPGDALTRSLLVSWALAPFTLTILHAQVTQHYYYVWYLIFALPAYSTLWALGVLRLGEGLRALTRIPGTVSLSLALVCTLAAILPSLMERLFSQRAHSVEPLRESVDIMRGGPACYPYSESDTLTAGFMMPSRAYDPAYIEVRTAEDLTHLAEYTRANGKTLYVAFGAIGLAEELLPDLLKELRNPDKFSEVAVIPGTWPFVTRHVYTLNTQPN